MSRAGFALEVRANCPFFAVKEKPSNTGYMHFSKPDESARLRNKLAVLPGSEPARLWKIAAANVTDALYSNSLCVVKWDMRAQIPC